MPYWYVICITLTTAQKMKFSIKDFFSKCEQILNRNLQFLCSKSCQSCQSFNWQSYRDPKLFCIEKSLFFFFFPERHLTALEPLNIAKIKMH